MIRSGMNVPHSKQADLIIRNVNGEKLKIESFDRIIKALANISTITIGKDLEKPEGGFSLIFSEGLKVTNNFDFSLLIEAGALFVGIVCAKQIFPLSVWAVKLSQFLYFPVDLGVLALALKENKINKIKIKNFLNSINLFLY